jgi:transposase
VKAWPEKSTREIAEQIGCSQTWVQRIKEPEVSTSTHLPEVTGKDGKTYPAKKGQQTERLSTIKSLLEEGLKAKEIAPRLGLSVGHVGDLVRVLKKGSEPIPKTKDARHTTKASRIETIRELAAREFSSDSIASKVGISALHVRSLAKAAGIVLIDAGLRFRRFDVRRFMRESINAAESATANLELVEDQFGRLDSSEKEAWIASLRQALRNINSVIAKLKKGVQQNG